METKVCTRCPERGPQPIDNFAIKSGSRRQSWCKECKRAYNNQDYASNNQYHRDRLKARRDSIRNWYRELKASLQCSRCPENHPACLQFHHRDPSEKDFTLSGAFTRGWSIQKLQEEIAKCDVLCANCHAKEHWTEKLLDQDSNLEPSG